AVFDRRVFHRPVDHLLAARIDAARQAAARTGVGYEDDMGALVLELLDEMVEFLVDDLFAVALAAGRIEPRQEKNLLHAVGLGTLDAFGLLRAMARQAEK